MVSARQTHQTQVELKSWKVECQGERLVGWVVERDDGKHHSTTQCQRTLRHL